MIPGDIGWIPSNGGLIGNLKVWENITLPLWYHHKRTPLATEKVLDGWLHILEPEKTEWAEFMARPSARLGIRDRKLVGLLRGLVLAPRMLVVDAELFNEVDQAACNSWKAALEKFVKEDDDRAVVKYQVAGLVAVVARGPVGAPHFRWAGVERRGGAAIAGRGRRAAAIAGRGTRRAVHGVAAVCWNLRQLGCAAIN